ncbi:tyrosine-type recombinase/integrase [Desulfovibrio desulfuricans]|uniref:tyrosine-type recombinase/integrase n=1 Tax=Desulfovibrio desulfuricans TaxID=876 RepID=UPI001C01536F|nr:site-specific integrase [Desulfovibrio desulfuricans]MBT9748662.1 tyrosine-type recombinase/integrase [Desulfovibrio desulfuricans]
MKRAATKYPGVTIYEAGGDATFYIRYRQPGSRKLIEEKAGKKTQGMTAAKASLLRTERMAGKALTNDEKRQQEAAKKAEILNTWTIERLYSSYRDTLAEGFSRKTDDSDFKRFGIFHKKEFSDLTTADIIAFKKTFEKKLSAKTIKNTLVLLNRIKNFGWKSGLIDMPSTRRLMIDMPKVDNERTEFLTADQTAQLIKILEEEKERSLGAVYMYIILLTGIRRKAALALKWNDIDEERNIIWLRGETAKNRKTNTVPLTTEVKNLLAQAKKLAPLQSDWIFPSEKNPGKQRESFRRVVESIHERAGLPSDFRPLHGLRHNFGSAGAAAGVEPSHRKELLTHSTLEMTERYTHLADKGMLDAAEKTVQEILKKRPYK